jgi:hypothetical protein
MVDIARTSPPDAGADAARLLQRLGYAVLAIGAPCAESLSSRAIFVFFPIGVALLLVAAMLDPVRGAMARIREPLSSRIAWCLLAFIVWTVLSLAWTPFPSSAVQHLGKLLGTALLAYLAVACMREHMRAGDLYLFPTGVAVAMLALIVVALAAHAGADPNDGRIGRAGISLVVLMWPAMACLAARGRNGYARLLLIAAMAFTFAIGAVATAAALLIGMLGLSFAISDTKRTAADLGLLAAAIIMLCPIAPAVAPALARWYYHAKLVTLSDPFPPLAAAADILLHDPLRLFTGHGFDAAIKGVENGLLPPHTPRVVLFELWYECGVIGAALVAGMTWFAFRALGAFDQRIAPYLIAALSADLTLAFLAVDFSQMWWATMLAVSAISAAAAFHSLYRTKRPAATLSRPTL